MRQGRNICECKLLAKGNIRELSGQLFGENSGANKKEYGLDDIYNRYFEEDEIHE